MEEITKRKEGAQESANLIDIIEITNVLWKKSWLIILCGIVGAVLALGYTKLFVTPLYQASSMIYVFDKSEGINLQLSNQLAVDFSILVKSRPVINSVIEDLNLNMSYEALAGAIQMENPENSNIMRITVTSQDPEFAKDVANKMADVTATQIAEVMLTDKPSMVEKAVIPKWPISPNLKSNAMKGGVIGMALIIAILILLHLMDDTIKSEDDMRKYLGINVLAVVPDRELYKGTKKRKK